MNRHDKPVGSQRHRFPPEIIADVVWFHFRFPLSLRLVEQMLLERGIVVSYEIVRRWALKFGPGYARGLGRKTPGRRNTWHLDEVVVTIAGRKHGCGRPSIKMDMRSTRSCRRVATPRWSSAC